MKHTTGVARGDQAGPAGGAEAAPGLADDRGAEAACDLGGSVRGAVVDDDRPVAIGHPPEHPGQGFGLVEHREDHVGHGADGRSRRR
jgi:hypothetical protein